jgi:hypothetical protein
MEGLYQRLPIQMDVDAGARVGPTWAERDELRWLRREGRIATKPREIRKWLRRRARPPAVAGRWWLAFDGPG